MKKLEFKAFDLQKLKVNSKGGLDLSWYEKGNGNELFSVSSDNQPHPDFIASLGGCKELLAVSLGLLSGWEFARENNRKNDEVLRDAVRQYNEEIERCNVTGLVLVGKDQYLGIKVTGSIKCIVGSVGLASPSIKFESDEMGVEERARELFDEISQEVWLYIFKEKRAQLGMFPDANLEDESGLNNMRVAL
jgi:hypothetical protein